MLRYFTPVLVALYSIFVPVDAAAQGAPTGDATAVKTVPATPATKPVPAPAAPAAEPAKKAAPAPVTVAPVAPVKDQGTAAAPKKTAASGWTIKLGGFVRGDISYNSGAVFAIESPLYALAEGTAADVQDKGLDFTARLTRISLNALAPKWNGWQARGYIETDFFGQLPNSGTSVRQSMLRMRLAYVELQKKWSTVRLGNDWMVAAPQFSSCLEPFNMWGQGNIWMRVPQLSLRNRIPIRENLRAEVDVAVGHNMGNDGKTDANADQLLVRGMGENSGLPMLQARVGLGFKLGNAAWSTVGASYSWQKLKVSGSADATALFDGTDAEDVTSSFIAVDTQIHAKLGAVTATLTGEFYQGKATASYWGGILRPVTFDNATLTVKVPESRGFFGDLKVKTALGLTFFGGYGQDNITNKDDYSGAGSPVKNQFFYAGVNYALGCKKKPMAIMGLSYGNLKTEFMGGAEGSAHLLHAMLMIPF